MSRKPSKFREAKRAQRAVRDKIATLHDDIKRVSGDTHIGEIIGGQLRAHAHETVIVIHNGDMLHGDKR